MSNVNFEFSSFLVFTQRKTEKILSVLKTNCLPHKKTDNGYSLSF